MTRTLGKLKLETTDGKRAWHMDAEPHVAMMAKRIFPRIQSGKRGVLILAHSPAICRDLEWFMARFPLDVAQRETLEAASRAHQERIIDLDNILAGNYRAERFTMALPPREYQAQAAELYLKRGFLLLGDDVGLGKTITATATFCEPATLPAVVVAGSNLQTHWKAKIAEFAPNLKTHIIKSKTWYNVLKSEQPDVLIITYAKLHDWAGYLAKHCRSVIYDEIQELRRTDSLKYAAAKNLSGAVDFALGLSATPIYNYGGEIFNVVDALKEGALGTRNEFLTEWCEGSDDKARLRDPIAFGSFAREQHIMLRRTRADVGRELPPLQRIVQEVESDAAVFDKATSSAAALARIILSSTESHRGERMQASGKFDAIMRQATGLAKAPFVAAFVRLLIESGESVVLFGWHHAVYETWLDLLGEFKPAMYTGQETTTQKDAARNRFMTGDTPLLIMSLRSGAGVDGFQHCTRTVVFGEFDWSPGVHEQCIGRVARDGQTDPTTAYFLMANDGADPIMAETLGLKREQIDGLRDLKAGGLERLDVGGANLRKLAEQYLQRKPQAVRV